MEFKPILAATCKHPDKIKFPVLATPKLDGIRCLMVGGKALTRSLKPIPNNFIRMRIESGFPDGVDGEILIPGMKFNDISSAVMKHGMSEAATRFEYWIFDYVYCQNYSVPYHARMANLRHLGVPVQAVKILPTMCGNLQALEDFEGKCLHGGCEGICFRDPDSPYKFGRSTEKQGWLLKLKRFEDSEATIIGFEEKMHNSNVMTRGELGQAKRATFKEGMVPMHTLGSLLVRDDRHHWTFSVGSGFDEEQRRIIWQDRKIYMGRMIKYKYQNYGIKNGPRFPIFLGMRDEKDM